MKLRRFSLLYILCFFSVMASAGWTLMELLNSVVLGDPFEWISLWLFISTLISFILITLIIAIYPDNDNEIKNNKSLNSSK